MSLFTWYVTGSALVLVMSPFTWYVTGSALVLVTSPFTWYVTECCWWIWWWQLRPTRLFFSTGLSRETSVMAPALAAPWLVPRKLTQSGRSLTLSVCCLPGQHLCVCVCVCVCLCVSMCVFMCVAVHVSLCQVVSLVYVVWLCGAVLFLFLFFNLFCLCVCFVFWGGRRKEG